MYENSTDTKSILEYKASSEERDVIDDVYKKMQQDDLLCKKPIRYFNYQSKETYINESVKRKNAFIPQRDPRDWRSRVFMNDTGDAANAILSFVAAQRMRANISARKLETINEKGQHTRISKILQSLTDYYSDKEQGDKKFYQFSDETITKGTGWRYEGYDKTIRRVKGEKSIDKKTGKEEYVWEERVENDNPISYTIPIENVFIPTFYCKDLQQLSHIIIRDLLPYDSFKSKYKKYTKSKVVPTNAMLSKDQKEGNYFFYQEWEERCKDGEVEVLHYYCKDEDIYWIIANGVLLNAIDNPIPFDHKQYPFQSANFEDFAQDFIWGKSLAFKLYSLQDVKNTLVNMAIDKEKFALIPAFLTSLQDEVEDNSIYPGARIQLSNIDQFRQLQMEGTSQSSFKMIEMVDGGLSKSSVDPSAKGQVSGETATALLQARSASIQIQNLFLNQLSWAMYDGYRQRLSNIIQLVPKDENAKEGDLLVKEFRLPGQLLSDGKMGTKIIRLIGDKKQKPTEGQMQEELLQDEQSAEIMYFTPEDLQNIDYFVEIIPTSSIPETQATRKAMVLELADRLAPFIQSGLVAPEKVLDKILEAYDEQIEDFMPEKPQGGAQTPNGTQIPPQLLQELTAKHGATSPLVQQLTQTKRPSSTMLAEQPL